MYLARPKIDLMRQDQKSELYLIVELHSLLQFLPSQPSRMSTRAEDNAILVTELTYEKQFVASLEHIPHC